MLVSIEFFMRYILMCFFVRFRHMQLEITKKYTLFKLQKRCKDFSRGVWFLTFSPSHIHFGKICLIQNLQFRLCSFQQKKVWLVSKSTRRPKRDRHLFQRLLHRCIVYWSVFNQRSTCLSKIAHCEALEQIF